MLNKQIKAALYYRLSREDEEKKKMGLVESDSIESQKLLLTQYAREREWIIYDEYTDDGLTGTNFDRAEFQRMLEDIEAGKVNLILVKDQSRLARNFAGIDEFLFNYCIERNVRVIGVSDGTDNFNKQNKKATQVTGLTNEWYAEDISNKVRASFDAKRKAGKFIGAIAPFGYKKNPDVHNHLIVDEKAAPVIKKIFNMYIDGNGYVKIAKTLTEENVPTPSQYKNIYNYNGGKIRVNHWSYHTVRRILMNEVYIGNLVQKKTKTISYKNNKRVNTHPSEIIRVEDTHEPIIDKDTFYLVQDMIAKNSTSKPTRRKKGKKHIFAGLLVCGDCGRMINYRSDNNNYFCNTYIVYGAEACTRHYVKFDDLHDAVLADIKYHINTFVEVKNLKESYNNQKKTIERKDLLEKAIIKNENRINEILKLKKSIYEDYRNKILDIDDYKQLKDEYNREEKELIEKNEMLKQQRNEQKKSIDIFNKWEEFSEKYINLKKLDTQILNELIDKIEIYEDKNGEITIDIHYKFEQPYIDFVMDDQYQHDTSLGRCNIDTEIKLLLSKSNSNIVKALNKVYNSTRRVLNG